jgi:hypothetical protein
MAVMAREVWTDERLDDLNARVEGIDRRMEAGFAEMRAEFVSVRRDMANQFAAQNRMMIQLFGGMFATMLVGFLGVIAAIVTQA